MKKNDLSEIEPMVSIIMAAYNSEKTISFAIESVLKQTFNNWELLIIDDNSVDNTFKIAESYTNNRVYVKKNEKNLGAGLTRKKALDMARGKWIAILDSDDAWKPEKLQKEIKLAEEKSANLVFTGSAFMNERGKVINYILHVPEKISYKSLLSQNIISNSSVIVSKRILKNFYVSNSDIHEDYATWLNIMKNGTIAYGIDEPLIIYRISKKSKAGNKFRSVVMNWKTYRYIELSYFDSIRYMVKYALNGFKKYWHIWREM